MRFYRALLRLYPASFRTEYGDEMCAIFAARLRAARGRLALVALWVEATADVVANAARVQLDVSRQDLKYAARTIRRSPGFTLTAVAVTALGVGATTAAFSLADHVLVRRFPFADADRLVQLWEDQTFRGYPRMELSPPNFRDWKQASASFEAMAAYSRRSVNLVDAAEPERLDAVEVTPDLLPMLGVQPAIGRLFRADDGRADAPGTVVISYSLWKARFGGSGDVLGRHVRLDDASYSIVGVMPSWFHFPSRDAELWTPMRISPGDSEDRTNYYLYAVAKLKAGVSLTEARQEMRLIAAALERSYPKENARTGATVNRLRDEVPWQARLMLGALTAASACVLLIACSNLANLLMSRALLREREMALRTALGAGRERLARQLLTESVALATIGGIAGVSLALVSVPLLARLVPNSLPIAEVPGVDLRMLAFAAAVTLATGIGFGMVPALRAGRGVSAAALQEGGRTGIGRRTDRTRSALVVAEVTACVVLLVSSGLLIRALWRVRDIDPGFRTEGVLTLRTSLPMPKYENTERRAQFYRRVLADLKSLPGVTEAAYISFLPMVMPGGIWPVTIDGRAPDPAESRMASLRFVTPGFFAATGVPVRLGRDVNEGDTARAPFVAVVSESFVRQYLPGQHPLGRRIFIGFQERTIVGVVGDIRVRGLERISEPQVYLPDRQVPDGGIIFYAPKDLVVKSATPPATLIPAVRRIVGRADSALPISDVRLLGDIVDAETAPRVAQVRVLGAFTAVAFLLAAVGLHGLLAYNVSTRAHEIGVRIALGAQSREILSMVLRQGVRLAAVGVVLGGFLAYAAGRAMQALLAGVGPGDFVTFAAAIALAGTMTVAGSLVPALRAVRTDPLTVIRAG